MDSPPDESLPHRGAVHLARVPFVAERTALHVQDRPPGSESSDESQAGFVAQVHFKLRPALVVQSDAITTQPGYEYVLVAPIYSVKAQHRAKAEFELLVTNRCPRSSISTGGSRG